MAGYPQGNNDPNFVRRKFLGLGNDDVASGSPPYAPQLQSTLNRAFILQSRPMSDSQRDDLGRVVSQSLELYIQGFLVSGNIFLLEGLRVNYPNASSNQARPRSPDLPPGCPENKYDYVPTRSSCVALLFYGEAVGEMLDVLARNRENSLGLRLKDVTTEEIPGTYSRLPNYFTNKQFPQYTYYLEDDGTQAATPVAIVPILTEAYMMGDLLRKQAQAAQTIAYRLWSAAYYSAPSQKDRRIREGLLDEAVRTLHAAANTQFLTSVAMAASVRTEPEVQGQTPFEFAHLSVARTDVAEAGSLINRIRNQEKPTLPIDEVMAGDAQVGSVMSAILGDGTGSLNAAQKAHEDAEAALFKVQTNAQLSFDEAQKRQLGFFDRLFELTGIDTQSLTHGIELPEGQEEYRKRVHERIEAILGGTAPQFVDAANLLDQDTKLLLVARQEVLNKKAIFDSYPERIKVEEDKLGADVKAIDDARLSISASQLAIGKANSVSITASAGVSYGMPTGFYAGLSVTYNPGAIRAAELQNDITYATALQDVKFRTNSSAAICKNLLIDQALAFNELKTQIIIFNNAEDEVRKVLGTTERLLSELRQFNKDASALYYHDPSFNTQQTAQEEKANLALDAVVRNLYKLGKLLEMRWLEPFSNPISVPGGQPIALDPQYDNFWSLESVFALGSVSVKKQDSVLKPYEAARNFFDALMAWESKLYDNRSFDGDLGRREISLREDVFGFPDLKILNGQNVRLDLNPSSNAGGPVGARADAAAMAQNVRRFQNILLRNGRFRVENGVPIQDKFRGFQIRFSLLPDNRGFSGGMNGDLLFGAISTWNYRVKSFKVKIKPLAGKTITQIRPIEFYFAQAGTTSNVDFFERANAGGARQYKNINLDNYVRYSKDSLAKTATNSPYLRYAPLAVGEDYLPDSLVPTTSNMAAQYWSPFTSEWILEVPAYSDFSIESIEDILIQIQLTSGKPTLACQLVAHCR